MGDTELSLEIVVAVLLSLLVCMTVCAAYSRGIINGTLIATPETHTSDQAWVRTCEFCGSPANAIKLNVNAQEIVTIFLCEECLVEGLEIQHYDEWR